jgi:hypothetical protein
MTIAAQFFTSVFPIFILIAIWVAAADTSRLAKAVSLPEESRSVLTSVCNDGQLRPSAGRGTVRRQSRARPGRDADPARTSWQGHPEPVELRAASN